MHLWSCTAEEGPAKALIERQLPIGDAVRVQEEQLLREGQPLAEQLAFLWHA